MFFEPVAGVGFLILGGWGAGKGGDCRHCDGVKRWRVNLAWCASGNVCQRRQGFTLVLREMSLGRTMMGVSFTGEEHGNI